MDALSEKPEEQPEGTFSKIMRFVRRFMGWENPYGFTANPIGPRGIFDSLYQASRFGNFSQGGGLGSQMWNAMRGFGGFGGGGAAGGAAAGTGAATGGAATATVTAPAAAAAAGGGGGLLIAAGVIIGVLLIFFLAIFISKNQDLAEVIPIQGTGGGGSTSGSFGPSYDFVGVCWPIAGPNVMISEIPENHRRDVSANGSAIDIAAPEGTPVQSSVDGTVVFAGEHGRPRPYSWKYGGLVVIQVDSSKVGDRDDVLVYYAHLSSVANGLTAGDPVQAGKTFIGETGNTGYTSGPHLHMEAINMSIYSLIPDWQPIYDNMPIPNRCEGGSETIL
jgi:murein DD-endopeptidase MepM/ murein hydrolase activator NlpD